MKLRVLATACIVLGSLIAAAAPAAVASNKATLIAVNEIHSGAKPGGGGGGTANCSNDGISNGLYATTGWKVGGPTTAHLNTSTVPSNLGSVTAALQASYDAWKGVDSATPKITVATDATATKPVADHSYELMWGRTSGGTTIAVTYTWRWSDGSVESDTMFNKSLPWFLAGSEGDGCYENQPSYEVRNIGTHEFGHTCGMDHPGNDRFETMYAYGYTGETLKWSPANGDTTGVKTLY